MLHEHAELQLLQTHQGFYPNTAFTPVCIHMAEQPKCP